MINGGSGEGDLAGGDGTSSSLASSEALELAIRALEKDGLLEQASSVGANSNLPQGLITIMTSLLSDKSTNTASNEEKPLLDRSHRRKLMTYLSERLSLETISRAIIQILPSLRFFDGKLPADLLLDLGFSGTQTKETFMAIWNRFSINPGKSGEREISKCLARLISASVGSKMNRGGVITPPPGSNPSPETIKALEEPPLDQDQQGNKTIDFETFVKSVNALLASSDGGSAGSGGKGSGGSDLDSALTIWSRIIRGLDDVPPSELIIPQGCRLESLATVLYSAPEGVAGLWGEWARPAWQLAAISGLLSLPNEIFSFCSNVFYPNSSISTSTSNAPSNSPPTSSTPEGIYATRIVSPEDVNNASLTIRNLAESVLNSNWNRRELIETIAREAGEKKPDQQTSEVSSQGGVKEPKEIATEWLEKGIKENPECVAIGLVMVKQPWNQVHSSLASKLLSMFLAGHPSHQLVFLRLWQIDWRYLLNSLKNLYNENQGNVSRILDVAQDLKILEAVLDLRVRELLDSDGNNSNEEEFITLKGEKLLEWNKQSFSSLDVAALASRREYLNLDKWLQDNINEFQQYSKSNPNNNNNGGGNQYTNGNLLIQKTLEFLDFKTKDDLKNQQRFLNDPNNPTSNSNSLPLMVQTVAIFLRVLRSNGDFMNSEEIEFFKVVRNLCLQLHPRLMNLAPGKENTEPGLQVVTFSSEIHKEADAYYTQMYDESLSIDDFVALLQRTKASSDPHDQQLFACLAHTLFDEYRCFETEYPARELSMTAIVFGSLIQHALIDYIPLGIAIRYVLDALRSPPDSNMFRFGVQALMRFQNRLAEWPQLGQALLSLPHLTQTYPEIERIIRNAGANGGASSYPSGGEAQVNGVQGGRALVEQQKLAFDAIGVDELEDDQDQEDPEVDVSDKILFLVNNLSPNNLNTKLPDAKRLITPSIYRWFSSYLVLQRVSIEPNNHGLYSQFIDGLVAPDAEGEQDPQHALLLNHVLHETFAKVKVLLNSDKTVQSTNERTLLKNLGSWLGGLTLARDKPIRHRNIAFKELLIQGYDSGRLIVAIPFVCKVLEQCSKSKVFVPPNPWLMAVLRLLVELYQFAELKLNLKFEIEVLCKSLNIDLKDVQPTNILRSRPTAEELARDAAQQQQQQRQQLFIQQQQQQQEQQQQLLQQQQRQASAGQDFSNASGGSRTPARTPAIAAQAAGGAATSNGAAGAAATTFNDTLPAMLANVANYMVINPQLTLFANNATLKRMIFVAIERAIREIIAPVAERSVTIASISTRELVVKDFAMEADENKMRKAAHQMAQNLAGSLALVTCKEPLRISMVQHARTLFLQSGFTEQTLPEQAIVVIMQDNLDLACSVIEKAAMEKALPEVDDGLAYAYSNRREHRARGRGYFWDEQALHTSQYAATLPDLLRLAPDGLQPQQLRVYEDFGNLARSPTEGAAERAQAAALAGYGGASSNEVAAAYGDEAGLGAGAGSLTAQQSLEKFSQGMADLDRLISQARPQESWSTLAPNHDIRVLLRQVPLLAAQSINLDETALAFSQKVVQLLYRSESLLAREVYVILLERLCELSIKVAKEATAWLIYAEDERKFNVPVTLGLIRAGLISITEQDAQLAKFVVREFRPSVIDFAAKLALECLKEPACATKGQLANTIEALTRAAQKGKATEAATNFLEELEAGQLKSKTDVGNTALREQLAYCFAEWVRLFQHSPNPEKAFIDFVTQLQTQGILKGEEISSMFFRVCTEVGVDSYIKQKAAGDSPTTGIFSPIDAFSKLVVLMIKYHADPTGANHEQAKVHYLTKILSIVVLVLAQSHEELGPHFQQKPFFRFFSSLLHDLHLTESSLQGAYVQTLLAISNTLNTLQPSFFPGFTFSWMSLISHRLFMPKLLLSPNREGWVAFHRLFASLLRFLTPFLRTVELRETSRSLYRGTLRILLVLLHDFPEFLVEYHHSLCDIIPTSCIQMRNLILSAFPRDRRLPDPFQPDLKIDRLPDVAKAPVIRSDYGAAFASIPEFKTALDLFLEDKSRAPSGFLATIKEALVNQSVREMDLNKGETRYNVPLVNSLVLTVGIAATEKSQNILNGYAHVDVGVEIFQQLLSDLDPEGRYLLLTAAANQLRFPCSHSAYFSYLVLYLFAETNDEIVKEQIARVLLERLIVNRPHPWALLLTTFELLRNRRYVMPKAPPEIERLLQHIKEGLSTPPGIGNGANGQPVGNGMNASINVAATQA